jgi:CDP-diacylglycerol--glycerol-3-phosphate 3-phosphatidyltransferase
MNLANRITLGRLGTSVALFATLTLLQHGLLADAQPAAWAAFAIFALTAVTDWFDGHVARSRGQVTVLGRMMDPFVDKVLVCGTLIFLTAMSPRLWPPWMVVVIVAREFLVSGIRSYMESQGISFAARWVGKVKMVLQCLAVGATLLLYAAGDPVAREPGWLVGATVALAWLALASTVHSGWVYTRLFVAHLGRLPDAAGAGPSPGKVSRSTPDAPGASP